LDNKFIRDGDVVMQVYSNVIRILNAEGVDYQASEHEPVRTSEEAARVRGVELKTGVKAMVLKTSEGDFFLILIPADHKVDFKKAAEMEKTKHVSLANPDEVLKLTGCKLGAVPPFGHKTKLKTCMQDTVLDNDWVNFNAGLRTRSVKMRSQDLKKIINPIMF